MRPDGWTALTLAAPPFNGNNYTFFSYLLPYVEQQQLFSSMTTGDSPPGSYCGGQQMIPLAVYVCPADYTTTSGYSQTLYGGGDEFGASSYVANYLVFGNPNAAFPTISLAGGATTLDASLVQGFTKLPAGIPDGMSNTIFFGEAFGSCGLSDGANTVNTTTNAGSLWADSTPPWRPIMCHNSTGKTVSAGYAPCNMFQVQPIMFSTCDPGRAQSGHSGGMNVALGMAACAS